MERIVQPSDYIGTLAEMNAMEAMSPGDTFQVIDDTAKTVEGLYTYSGAEWCKY